MQMSAAGETDGEDRDQKDEALEVPGEEEGDRTT